MAFPSMRCRMATARHCRSSLLLALASAAVADAISGSEVLLRREGTANSLELDSKAVLRSSGRSNSSLVLKQAIASVDSQGRSCPGGVTCGQHADNIEWSQACWDCLADYQEFYCEKNSLTSPKPTFVDVCARQGSYRGAFCKKFAEKEPPDYYEDCFFQGSEYKQIYCEKMKLKGAFKNICATDTDVGPGYCEGFAMHAEGYVQCKGWPGFMLLYCESKQNSTTWDATCANHHQIGANYCEDFALAGDIRADCEKYPSYLTLFCDTKASNNVSVDTCASNDGTSGMYCQELALKKNGFKACWGVAQFDSTYCAEIPWSNSNCEALAGTSSTG